jgi:hypothetical protein
MSIQASTAALRRSGQQIIPLQSRVASRPAGGLSFYRSISHTGLKARRTSRYGNRGM